ncbi:SgrR family transcriptional regulator [Peribacillus deserti]|uniref:SgrR family transcriptional regulator n=1 Tax=Peribacillus deserti TaxID=673318 RepID=A0A2N5M8S1_9BACI|nr:SgrR family transcriptional regulator [Peribacillus deserti]PLT30742.1 SgrR family transcriptional regulator [Peribacillus deserti]
MKSNHYYLEMRLAFYSDERDRMLTKSLGEIAEVLCCSTKNAKRILTKLEDNQSIIYSRGRGRGNKSTITFTCSLEHYLKSQLKSYIKEEKFEEALALLKMPIPASFKESLTEKLHRHVNSLSSQQSLDVIRTSLKRPLSSMDPAFVSISTESHIVKQVFDTLVIFNDKTSTIEPHLAHTWEYHEEQNIWTFYIRKGIKFHNGKSLTSEDIAYSFTRLREIDSPNKWLMEDVISIQTPTPYVVHIILNKKNTLFLHYLCASNASILPAGQGFDQSKIIGSGPFFIKSFNEHGLILGAFDSYFKERAFIDRIEFWYIPVQEKVDIHYELPGNEATHEQLRELSVPEVGCTYIGFNFKKTGIVRDLYFRKAIFELLDSKALIDELGKELKLPASSFFPWISRQDNIRKSLEQAKEYLQKSSYHGETLYLYFFDMKDSSEDASWFQKRCRFLGIHVELRPFSIQHFYEETETESADLILMGEIFQPDIDFSFTAAFKNSSCFINRFLTEPYRHMADEKVNQFISEHSLEKRRLLMREIEEWIMQEHLFIFNYHSDRMKRYHGLLEGVSINSFGWADFRDIWIKPPLQLT